MVIFAYNKMTTQNHRKFDDKIAEQKKRQEVETDEFNKVMAEVNRIKTNQHHIVKQSKCTKRISVASSGSLPDVSYITTAVESIVSNSDSPILSYLFIKPILSDDAISSSNSSSSRSPGRPRQKSPGGAIRRPSAERTKLPYTVVSNNGNNAIKNCQFLPLPSADQSCRRSISDSNINQFIDDQRSPSFIGKEPVSSQSYNRQFSVPGDYGNKRTVSTYINGGIPGIRLDPSPSDLNQIQIPINKAITGSLPDLTFPYSIDPGEHSPVWSSNPSSTTSNVSPTSIYPEHSGGVGFPCTPPHESPGSPSYGPVSPTSGNSSKHLSVPHTNSYPAIYQGDIHRSMPNLFSDNNYHDPSQQSFQLQLQPGSPIHQHTQNQTQQQQHSTNVASTINNNQMYMNSNNNCNNNNNNMTVQTNGDNSYDDRYSPQQHQLPQMPSSPQSPHHQLSQMPSSPQSPYHQLSQMPSSPQSPHHQLSQMPSSPQSPHHQLSQMPSSPQSPHHQAFNSQHSSPTRDELSPYSHPLDSMSYRTPQNTTRPSPQSSPGLSQTSYVNGGCPSPLSAPPSPTLSCGGSVNNNGMNTSSIYDNFSPPPSCQEHLLDSLQKIQVTVHPDDPCNNSVIQLPNGIPCGPCGPCFTTDDLNSTSVTNGNHSYYITSTQQLPDYPVNQAIENNVNNTARNTPTSVPDITIDDFSQPPIRDDFPYTVDDFDPEIFNSIYETIGNTQFI